MNGIEIPFAEHGRATEEELQPGIEVPGENHRFRDDVAGLIGRMDDSEN